MERAWGEEEEEWSQEWRRQKGPAQDLLLAFPRPLDCPSLPLSPLALPRVDSIMLVEEGFSVTSVDASDKMLKYALKERWNRRHEPAFDKWGTHVQAGLPRPAPQGPVLLIPVQIRVFVFPKGTAKLLSFPQKGRLRH